MWKLLFSCQPLLLSVSCRTGRALLVMPVNVLKNWGDEFSKWLPSKDDTDYKASRLNKSGRKILTVGHVKQGRTSGWVLFT